MRRLARGRLIFVGIGLSLVFWFLEALLHVLVFDGTDLAGQVFRPHPHEAWMRLTVMGMFVAFGVYAQRMLEARRRAEAEARLAGAELNQIFETAADGMRVVDREFTVLRANQTFADLVGRPKTAIVGRKCHEVFRGDRCGTEGCPLTRVLNGEERVEYDAEKLRPDGRSVPCMVTATPFRRPDGELLGIVEDFRDISERRRGEQELRASQGRLSELAAHLQVVREEERGRIAREIHDELGQTLTALNMDLHWLGRRLAGQDSAVAEKVKSMSGLIAATVGSVRRICSELRPGILDDFGLAAAIEWQAEELGKRTGIACEVEVPDGGALVAPDLAIAVFRILQEVLTNVVRHAEARRVRIRLTLGPGALALCVEDDGKGMADPVSTKGKTFGLLGIRERVRDFGGQLRIDSSPGKGTRIEVRIPLPDRGETP